MKRFLAALLCALIAATLLSYAQGNQFKVRYRGGTVETKVKPDDWGNKLAISSEQILLALKDGQKIEIAPKQVTKISYGKDDARDAKRMVSITAYLFTKKRRHYITVEYLSPEGKPGAMVLQAKGDAYRTILTTLKTITGKEVETEEKGNE